MTRHLSAYVKDKTLQVVRRGDVWICTVLTSEGLVCWYEHGDRPIVWGTEKEAQRWRDCD